MPVEITHKFICAACGYSEHGQASYNFRDVVPIPIKPSGWILVEGTLLCPKHEVKRSLFIDGKEVFVG